MWAIRLFYFLLTFGVIMVFDDMEFGNLEGVQHLTKESVMVYHFEELRGEEPPWIEFWPVTEVNKKYTNALLKKTGKIANRMNSGKNISAKVLTDRIEEDKELYAKYVCTGKWGGWKDKKTGKEIPFTRARAAVLFERLPDWIFKRVCRAVEDITSFIELNDEPDMTLDEVEELEKN